MSAALDALLRHRLLLICGKGGTGKTSLTAALAHRASRAGIRTTAVDLAHGSALPSLLADAPPLTDSGREPRPLGGGLHHLQVVPERALDEYLESQLHAPRIARRVVEQPLVRRLLDAAPGWRDLIALGKLWHLTTRVDVGGARWPLLIVDAPATGHGLALLSGPTAVAAMLRGGPLRRHVDAVLALLRDPERTLLVPVALAEELAVNEVLELQRGAAVLGIRSAPVIVNRTEPPLPDAGRLRAAITALGGRAPHPLLAPDALRRIVDERVARRALQEEQLQRVRRATGVAPIELPELEDGVGDPRGARALATALEHASAQREAAR